MANLQKVIKVTQQQYDILAAGGTVGDYTGLDANYLYLVVDENNYVLYDSNGNVTIINGHLIIQDDNGSTYTGDDWDTTFYADQIEIVNASNSDAQTFLRFPDKGQGTFTLATTDDLPQVKRYI